MPSTATLTFTDRLQQRIDAADSLLCVGIDPTIARMPEGVAPSVDGVIEFCVNLIEATKDDAAIYKPNLGFFVGLGRRGLEALWEVRQAIPQEIPVLLDCKIADIDSTAKGYATGWFDEFDFDAITVNAYMGEDSLAPFLQDAARAVFVVCKTSNPGSGDLQDITVQTDLTQPLYHHVAKRTKTWNETYPATVGVVVGATWPEQLREVRALLPDQPILLPGIGAQGGDLAASVAVGTTATGTGLLCSASRSIMYASSGTDYADAARTAAHELRLAINEHRPRG